MVFVVVVEVRQHKDHTLELLAKSTATPVNSVFLGYTQMLY